MTDERSFYERALIKARYAINSESRALTYEAYGYVQGLSAAGVLDKKQVQVLTDLLVRDTMNARRWVRFH